MQPLLKIPTDKKTPKYQQIVDSVMSAIRQNRLKKGDAISSINELSDEFMLSRDTVQKAYIILQKKGLITAVKGKGFYIKRSDITMPCRVLLLFNKISNYKKQVYNAVVETMGEKAIVDLKIHHFSTRLFDTLVSDAIDEYDYFILMPHFYDDAQDIYKLIKKIPSGQLLFLDKDLPHTCSKYAAVYQDFTNDIYEALEDGWKLISKYKKLVLVFPKIIPYPKEIVIGFRSFCNSHNLPYCIIDELKPGTEINQHEAYIVIEETDLVTFIKCCKAQRLQIGKDVGVISYNDTPLKEILLDGITVISTDHYQMGVSVANLILEKRIEKIKNPFAFIERNSL